MIAWMETMPLIEKLFFYVAVPATLILLIQTVMLFLGGADVGDTGDFDIPSDTSALDFDGDMPTGEGLTDVSPELGSQADGDFSFDSYGLRFVTMRGIIAFLTIAGWVGVCCIEFKIPSTFSILISFAAGAAAMVGIAYLVKALLGLQSSGNINYRSALGQSCDVYLTIPAEGKGTGKISLTLGGAFSQYDAITNGAQPIKTGELVRVVDIVGENVMVVERETQ